MLNVSWHIFNCIFVKYKYILAELLTGDCIMQEKKYITYVTSHLSNEKCSELTRELLKDFPELEFSKIDSIQEIFPLLSRANQKIDFIVLDVDDLYSVEGADVFDIIRTLSTLIHCTVCREEKRSKPAKRNTKLVASISESTSYKLFKEVVSLSEIDFLSLRYGSKVSYDMVKESVMNYIHYGERVPKVIFDFIKSKKTPPKESSDKIFLTARQQQIYNLIITRGVSNKVIAKTLKLSESTVKLHVGVIFKKYGVKNRTQLAVFSKNNTLTEV